MNLCTQYAFDTLSPRTRSLVFTSSSLRILHCTGVTLAGLMEENVAFSSSAAAFNRSNLREAITTLQPVETKWLTWLKLQLR